MLPETPNICSRLASSGLTFRNAWANPSCSPTRASLLTGRYGFRTGVLSAGWQLPLSENTIAAVLGNQDNQRLGYSTAAFGKWHLSGAHNFGNCQFPLGPPSPREYGYQSYAGSPGNLQLPGSYSASNYSNWCRWKQGDLQPDGTYPILSGKCSLFTNPPGQADFPECHEEPDPQPYATIVTTNDALRWIEEQSGHPWFLWLGYNAPHDPFHVPPTMCPGGGRCYPEPCPGCLLHGEGQQCTSIDQDYCWKAMIETMDTEIGRVLDALPADTVVVFLGDNGTDQRISTYPSHAKFTLYEGGVHVPLIIASPRRHLPSAGEETTALVNASDLFATILELVGASVPEYPRHDSVSLVPLLGDSQGSVRSYVFADHSPIGGSSFSMAARNSRFKMIQSSSSTEFYDLSVDPKETDNILEPDPSTEAGENFAAIQEYMSSLVPPCPTTTRCSSSGSSCTRQEPAVCGSQNLGVSACLQNGALFRCPARSSIRVQNCACEASGPGPAACFGFDQSWWCEPD